VTNIFNRPSREGHLYISSISHPTFAPKNFHLPLIMASSSQHAELSYIFAYLLVDFNGETARLAHYPAINKVADFKLTAGLERSRPNAAVSFDTFTSVSEGITAIHRQSLESKLTPTATVATPPPVTLSLS
jgi:hypothetical protein